MNPALRLAIAAIFAAAFATLLFPLYLSLLAGSNKVFEPQSFDFALVAVAAFAIALGALTVPWRSATNVAVLGLLAGAGLLFVLARAIRRAPLSAARPAALGGAVIGYGLVLVLIGLLVPPTVECFANGGGSTSSQRWNQSGGGYTVTSSGTSTIDGVQTGRIESPDSIATYRCEQGRIVEFHREAR